MFPTCGVTSIRMFNEVVGPHGLHVLEYMGVVMVEVNYEVKKYGSEGNVVFRKTKERFGGLSNMCSGYKIVMGEYEFLTSESLYQCCRFNNDSDIQRIIIDEKSPISSKMKSKKYRSRTRTDWDQVRVDIMDWSLRIKLKCNWMKFSRLLLSTGKQQIVEDSHKDRFWGCVENKERILEGANVLGQLLMNLRREIQREIVSENSIRMKKIDGLRFFGESVEEMMDINWV